MEWCKAKQFDQQKMTKYIRIPMCTISWCFPNNARMDKQLSWNIIISARSYSAQHAINPAHAMQGGGQNFF